MSGRLVFRRFGALVVLAFLAGCASKPPEVESVRTLCDPLPLCEIPAGSTSTQLEEALYRCVLEYRALYSVCYNMQHAQAFR